MMFGIGPVELLILVGVGLLLLIALVAVLAVAFRSTQRAAWVPPPRTGPATSIQAIGSQHNPISENARWDRDELTVQSNSAGTVNLFDVPLPNLEQQVLLYRFNIKPEAMKKSVYAEMWCHVAGKGRFFSRGLDQKPTRVGEWQPVEIPFYLSQGDRANLVNLNLVFEGAGAVRIRDIEVQAAPVA